MFTVRRDLKLIATFETEEEALRLLASLNPVFVEADADHPGCHDAFLKDGTIVSINRKKVLVSDPGV